MRAPRLHHPAFAVAAGVWLIVCVAVLRLPEAFVAVLGRRALLQGSERDWAFFMFIVASLAQAAYAGFFVLRIDRIETDLRRQGGAPLGDTAQIVGSLDRNASGISLLTLVYGLAVIGLTGRRAAFWPFALLSLLQGAWYLRAVGGIAQWLERQPVRRPNKVHTTTPVPADYCPPLARDLIRRQGS